jgi:hypothetical protein
MLVAAGDDDHQVEFLVSQHDVVVIVDRTLEPFGRLVAAGGINITDGGHLKGGVVLDPAGVHAAAAAPIAEDCGANRHHGFTSGVQFDGMA